MNYIQTCRLGVILLISILIRLNFFLFNPFALLFGVSAAFGDDDDSAGRFLPLFGVFVVSSAVVSSVSTATDLQMI